MRRRAAAVVMLVTASSVLLAGCDGEIIDAIESAAPSASISLPDIGGGGETEQPPAETTTEEPPQTEEPQTEEPAVETPAATTPTDETASTSSDSGIPLWAWILLGLALVGLVALLIASARRRGSSDEKALAAQADGQLSWVRSNVDDPLLRWRADQLRLPAAQRDTDSELARRWALVDQRVTAATTDLLTIESSTKNAALQQASALLRQAAEGYRTSLDALAQALVTGDQARIAQASQGLNADTTMFDQARQRFHQTASL